jgi:hypothetical protein
MEIVGCFTLLIIATDVFGPEFFKFGHYCSLRGWVVLSELIPPTRRLAEAEEIFFGSSFTSLPDSGSLPHSRCASVQVEKRDWTTILLGATSS